MKIVVKTIRRLLLFFSISLAGSGATAMPVGRELQFLLQSLSPQFLAGRRSMRVLKSYQAVPQHYPVLLYGYDWLAFAHFALGILFLSPYNHPAENSWVIRFGLIASALIVPFAFSTGVFRNIPFWWRLIDCSFGVIGFAVLFSCYKKIRTLTQATT